MTCKSIELKQSLSIKLNDDFFQKKLYVKFFHRKFLLKK